MLVLLTGRIQQHQSQILAADASPVSVITFKFERMYLPATAMENVSLNFKEYEPSIANSLEIRFEIVHLPLQFDVIQFLQTKITKTTCKSTSFTYFVVVNCPKEMSFAKLVRYGV
jgi:hypothetical protein